MKLRTSFFNPTVFRKDLTRFAPTWALYAIGLFMMMAICLDAPSDYRKAFSIAETISLMAGFNLCYALLNGQLLFGDLFNSRHVNALHAMPLRRECWYFTHMVSGLAFSFVPNLVMALVASLMMGTGWMVPFWWLLAVTLQYVCFFGLAVLSALCVGNRFAMVLVYAIINFIALILYWFYYSIYEPYNLELWRIYGEGKITKDELNRRRFSHPLESVGISDADLAARFCKEALSRIPSKGNLVPGAIELLEYLRPKYRMFILSNGFVELQSRKMAAAGIDKYFDDVILSEEIGINKPRPELFEYALKKTGSLLEESIMIGDMFDTDIKGAANIGMQNIFFNPKGEQGHTFAPTYEVTSLLQIKEIL